MENETIVLNRKELMELRARYAQKQADGEQLQAEFLNKLNSATNDNDREKYRVFLNMYVYQTGKSAGFKEGIDEIFYKADGTFPECRREVA